MEENSKPEEILELSKQLASELYYQFNMSCVLINNPRLIKPIQEFINLCKKSRNDISEEQKIKAKQSIQDFSC